MSSPNLYTKRRSPPNVVPPSVSSSQPQSKPSGGGFFCKSVLFALFLLALPLFPSQAPDFVGETVFTKFWELIHLLFVGIAVAYGLFSRRNVESDIDLRMSRVDESSLSYVSRIFQVTSVFDEEYENSCEFRSEDCSINVTAQASVVGKSESFVVESELEESSEYGKINEVRAWNSQYFQGRSKVVVARPDYGLDGHVVHQPLGLPVRSLRSALRDNVATEDDSFSDEAVNRKAESLADDVFDEVLTAPSSPVVPWDFGPEMMGMGDNYPSDFHHQSVDETQFGTVKSTASSRSTVSSSSSSQTSFASQTQNIFSPSRSVSQESLNSNVEELVKEKSLQSSSRSSSPSLPPSPSLALSPPSPELVADDTYRRLPELITYDTHRRASHSRHYSDGSLLEEDVRKGFEDELEGNKVRGRRTEFVSKKERGSKSLKLTAATESSRRGSKSRRSYPPESTSFPIGAADDSSTRRRDLQQKSDTHLLEDNIRKGLVADHNNLRVKKGRSYDSLELSAEDEKISEPVPVVDVVFQPTNAKTSRRAMHSSRGVHETLPEKDVTRNLEDDTVDSDKSRKKDLPGNNNKDLKSNSPRLEPRSWRASSNVSSLRGKSVRTIRSDRRGKDIKADGDSSDDRAEAKVESRGRPKSRRQQQELSIVLHQDKSSETRAKFEPEEVAMEETEAEQQPQVTLEEEEEEEAAAWERQSNASHDHNEVDRKAGEFIAKFREQIRLQKLVSGEQPRGGGTGMIRNSHFR